MMSREHRSAQHTARRENPTTETPLPLLISFAFDATGGRELVILQATEQQLSQTTFAWLHSSDHHLALKACL